ncbi:MULTISPECIES: universal stress protein [unclassified Moorena]|uniref:universal stress protein n=1 Tax=unclassified Moorena TaxID=2683338 RepID=UPI00140036BD|nr:MULTISPECIES: universal stress protein [unclassified Moorena]NEO13075.1 universal stress protein [Moorena sp. SIO3E8]NEP98093.1 universal stress protein [Moorena sp. SIO3F7]
MSLFATDRVLVPIDFSETSFEALAKTIEFVKDASHIYVIHVLPPLNPGEPGVMWRTVDSQTRKSHVEKVLSDRFKEPQYQGIHVQITIGNPASNIIDYAREQAIDLIVIPSHGYTGLKRFVLGSVAERVVRFAHCPVLVLRREV